ncbi:MAG: alanine--tRNA ligase [Magnetococcales bacterium]|nr:alanine--tRNA ligase [Magnetococcales bacterium]
MKGSEIRKRFVTFFEGHGHTHVASSSLIPQNDPTLLFANAGMNQFKSLFLGEERRDYVRAVSSQKCVRAGGKHNDLENVGRTARHHTFFEMLGNFSFGDYFKEQAIQMAWAFVTEELGLPGERLIATVYAEDEDAYRIWREKVGLPEDRVIRIATNDNFWSMGDTGPCGPCSEIFYDFGPEVEGGPPGSPEEDGDRFVEVWNLVFMQYNRDASGEMTPLPDPCIDTGAGLERLTTILQGHVNNYDSDLFQPLIQGAAEMAGRSYGQDLSVDVSLRVIADHLRALCFLISDGVLPSNEGRGYVLRRIMRRAMRHGRMIGMERPFLHQLVPILVEHMGDAFPELRERMDTVIPVTRREEERFVATLGTGLKILEEKVSGLSRGDQLDGETVFILYDTYGFPTDLTADALRDRGVVLDMPGFEERMEQQRARARAAWSGSGDDAVIGVYHGLRDVLGETEFLGYDTERASGRILAIVEEGQKVESLTVGGGKKGKKRMVGVIVNQTPFYAESGGQVGDEGTIESSSGGRFLVHDVQRPVPGPFVHRGELTGGTLEVGDDVELLVDIASRGAIRRHHSATHLLHHALQEVLGDHVKQSGSNVAQDRLRFDFSHYQGVARGELASIEDRVTAEVLANHPQRTVVMSPEEAVEAGATALFGEKYGESVRVVEIGPSKELCGGTHVNRSGDIGLFRILSESAVAAGVRRIEAVCGPEARRTFQREAKELKRSADLLKTRPEQVSEGVTRLLDRVRDLERDLAKAKSAMSGNLVEDLAAKAKDIAGVTLLAEAVPGVEPKELRDLLDRLKDRLGSAVILLGAPGEGKVALIAGVTPDLAKTCKAGDLIRTVAPKVGGKGGGRPDMAQGGGSEPEGLPAAIEAAAVWLRERVDS